MQSENYLIRSFISYIEIIRQSQLNFYFFSEFSVRHDELLMAWPPSGDTVYTVHLEGYKQH